MRFRFANLEIDSDRLELRRSDGSPIAIEPTPLRLLIDLLSHHPRTRSRAELLTALWPATAVTDASLARAVTALRRAIGENGRRHGIVQTVQRSGYRIGVPVECLAAASPNEASRGDPFVGREALLGALSSALDAALDGRGGIALLLGEPGIGKTRTASELSRRARARGPRVLWGRSGRAEGQPALWPWIQVLRELATQQRRDAPDAPPAGELAALVPELVEGVPAAHAPAALDPAHARFRLYDAVGLYLNRAAHTRPLLLVLEDLHQADRSTLELLRFLAPGLDDQRILVVATSRDVAPPLEGDLADCFAELAALPAWRPTPPLGPLSLAEIAEYVATLRGRPASGARIEEIFGRSGGNPLFVRELVRTLGEGDEATVLARASPRHELTPGIQALVRERTRGVSEACRELALLAAVVGREVPLNLLQHLFESEATRFLEALEEAESAGLLAESPDDPGSFRFTHDLVRDALYESLSRARRLHLHHRVACALEKLLGVDPDAHLPALAHHFLHALPGSDSGKAVEYARRAGRQARERFAFAEAAGHFRQALTALSRGGHGDTELRCDLSIELAEASRLAGTGDLGIEAAREGTRCAARLGDAPRFARAALATASWLVPIVPDPESTRLLEEALARLGPAEPALRAAVLARLALHQQVEGREREARSSIARAHALSEQLDEDARAEAALHRLLVLRHGAERATPEQVEAAEEALAGARRGGRGDLVLQVRRHRVDLFLILGDGAALDPEIEVFAREAEAAHVRSFLHLAATFRAMRALHTGRYAEANPWMQRARELADPQDPGERRFTPTEHENLLPREPARDAQLEERMRRIVTDFPQIPAWRIALAQVRLRLGRRDEAGATLEHFARDGFGASIGPGMQLPVARAALAEIAAELGAVGHAARLYDLLAPTASLHVTTGWGVGYHGPVAHWLGLLAATLGRTGRAALHFEASLAACARLGARPWEAMTRVAWARMLGAAADASARERRRELAAHAAATAAELGMDFLRREAEAII